MKKILIVILVLIFSISLASCSFTTANLSDLAMAKDVDANNLPLGTTVSYATDAPAFYATGLLKNAPSNTKVTAEWYYLDPAQEIFIDSSDLICSDTSTSFSFSLSIPDNGWPAGNYEVRFLIDDKAADKLAFSVN